ncbi:SsrA-binding protein [Desulfovibrionales bacterium]
MVRESGIKLISTNRKVRYFYEVVETIEAGIAIMGSEVKSLREGKVSFKDGYVDFRHGEAFLVGVYIAVYVNAGYAGHEPERVRKLLLHDFEIARLIIAVEQKGLTVVPLKIYFKVGIAKLEIGVARGKRIHDRRDVLKDRAQARDTERELFGS